MELDFSTTQKLVPLIIDHQVTSENCLLDCYHNLEHKIQHLKIFYQLF